MDKTSSSSQDAARFERMAKHLPGPPDATLIVLKGHLLAEEMLESILMRMCNDRSALKDVEISFFLKLKLVVALTGYPGTDHVWKMAETLNSLRNQLAHKLDSPKSEAKLDRFLLSVSPHDEDVTADRDLTNLTRAVAFFLGCLHAVENRAAREHP